MEQGQATSIGTCNVSWLDTLLVRLKGNMAVAEQFFKESETLKQLGLICLGLERFVTNSIHEWSSRISDSVVLVLISQEFL